MQPKLSLILFYSFSFILLLSGLFYIYAQNFKVKAVLLSLNSFLVAAVILFFMLPYLAVLQVLIFGMAIPLLLYLKNKKVFLESGLKTSNHLVAPGFLVSLGLFLTCMYILSHSRWRGFGPPEDFPPTLVQLAQNQFWLALILIGLSLVLILFQPKRKKDA